MEPDFKEGDQVLVSTLNFNNLKVPKKMRESFLGPFTIIKLIGGNAVEVKITKEFCMKHPVLPKSLIKPYFQTEEDRFPSRKRNPTQPGPVEKIIKDWNIGLNGKDQRQYLVGFKTRQQKKIKSWQ
ncbi:hypothetical protein O181_015690 [Austropuccinia psidii MF-1]|uniref:Uncharacterized protein n=1 Tax=Austropuccinia psidii MF-1 TaxID=1389203 RepID=A0A9Q3GR70_9BASI|nr:hypothetical protein [Austropuccinia psidii MF-1]